MRFEKINIGPIVTGHFGSLEHVQSRRIRWDDVVIHLAVPLVSGIIAFLVKARFVSDSAADKKHLHSIQRMAPRRGEAV